MIASAAADRLPRWRGSPTCRSSRCRSCCCPGELVPLHIFEPRYRELVARCMDGPEPFCVVLEDDEGRCARSAAWRATSTVLERMADGRLNIAVTGGEPVRIGPVDDERALLPRGRGAHARGRRRAGGEDAVEAALAAYRELLSEIGREEARAASAQPRLSYALAARIDLGLDVRQALLESRSERARPGRRTRLVQGRHSLRIAADASAGRCAMARSIRPTEHPAGHSLESPLAALEECSQGRRLRFPPGAPAVAYSNKPSPQARKRTSARGSSG